MAKILLVDDEISVFRNPMEDALRREGYEVITARDGVEALRRFSGESPQLVLLDVDMPKKNGFAVCEEIRRVDSRVPVLFLTNLESEADQLRGLGIGADDYILKTSGFQLIIARVRNALSRSERTGLRTVPPETVRLGEVSVDLSRHVVELPGGEVEPLTAVEARVLSALAEKRGAFLSQDELIASAHGAGYACEDSLVYTVVSRMRRKLGPAARMIVTKHGAGYSLVR